MATPSEELNGWPDVLRWAETASGVPPALVRRLTRNDTDFAAAISLREALYRIFAAVSSGSEPDAADLALFGGALARAAPRSRIVREGGAFLWQIASMPADLPALLSPVLWSAADLLTGHRLARVRQCGNPQCRWLFLDDSKSGNRRWCSMASCGNRAKAHRHYLRSRGMAG